MRRKGKAVIQASGKKKLEARKADAELLENQKVHVVKRDKQKVVKNEISISEMQELIGDTLERVWPEVYGQSIDRLNAVEYYGHLAAMQFKIGPFGDDGRIRVGDPVPMSEHTYKRVPLCDEHG